MSSVARSLGSLSLVVALGRGADALAQDTPGGYTLFAGGDAMLARWVHQAVDRDGPEAGFRDVLPLVRDADVALANLECVVSTRGDFYEKGENKPYLYRARPEMLDVLTLAGFDVLATANNHTMDYGPDALLEELDILRASGVTAVGAGSDLAEASAPRYLRVGDAIMAFISVEDSFALLGAKADRPGVFHADPDALVETLKGPIAEARARADLVVLTPHWGTNWTENPTDQRVQAAHQLVDLGVDAILGHSSHVLHGVEVYRGRPIVYDMGSLYFDTIGQDDMRFSAGFSLEFDRGGFRRLTIHPFLLQSCRVTPATGTALDQVRTMILDRSRALDPTLAFRDDGTTLALDLDPGPPRPPRAADPAEVDLPGRSIAVPAEYRDRLPSLVLDEPPAWCTGFTPVALSQGVTVLCWRHAEAVRPRNGFVTETVLRVSGPLDGRWEAWIVGNRTDGGASFEWQHPIADGAWIPDRWKPGQIVIDRTMVRPTEVPPGTYDLSWRLGNARSRERAWIAGAPGQESDVPIGSLAVMESGIPRGPAGLAWDGRLPAAKKAENLQSWTWPVAGATAVALALIGAVLWVRARKRAS